MLRARDSQSAWPRVVQLGRASVTRRAPADPAAPALLPGLAFGTYPTPVALLEPLSSARTSLWVKRDDLTHPVYGGSKIRKLEPLLAEAVRQGARQVVTVGALGSHHVLATGVG